MANQLGMRIVQETARKEPEKLKPEARQVCSLRASDVSTVTRVRNVAEWVELMTKLDQRVRSLFGEGYDVELN